MKVVVVDNEEEVRNGLVELIKRYCPQVKEIKEAEGVETGIKLIYNYQPDLVFTDVEMDDGTGMEMLSKIPNPQFQVIFITAFNKYAINAFKFSAIDFLLKPIDIEELTKAVAKAEHNLKLKSFAQSIQVFNENSSQKKQKIVLKEMDFLHVINLDDIIYLKAEGIYTTFYINNQKEIILSKNLKEYEELLPEETFLRIHNSYLVNVNFISKYDKRDGGCIVLQNNTEIPVSQRKKEDLMKYLKNI